jgi:tellurite resistance protein
LDFIVIASAYMMKLALGPTRVNTEFRHPIVGSLFATIFISLLLLPIVLAPYPRRSWKP